MIRLPKIALSRPPAEPGGGVICVNTASDRPPKPFHSNAPRISTSQPMPNSVAPTASAGGDDVAAAAAAIALCQSIIGHGVTRPAFDAHQHVARDRQHDEGDDEQDQAEFDQR